MSGLEIAGIVLGSVPILIEGLRIYKSSLKTIGKGFRKRKTVEKLSRSLMQQRDILEELLKQMLLSSGCSVPSNLEESFQTILCQEDIDESVADYLGKSYDNVIYWIRECSDVLAGLAQKVARLTPSQVLSSLMIVPPGQS